MARAGDHLNNNTDGVDDAAHDDSPLATNPVGHVTGDESAKEGTAGQDRDDERGVGVAERLSVGTLYSLVEDGRGGDTVDVTGIVTEEDTTEGGESAEEVGLPGDGGLNGLDILRGVEGDVLLAELANVDLFRGRYCCSRLVID